MSRSALLWLALAALAALPGVTASGADFTAASSSSANTFTAAADFNTVTVDLTDPGSPLVGAVTLEAAASSERGIESVVFQRSSGGGWSDVCTDTEAPYSCEWDTEDVTDGTYDLRARATDEAGYTRTDTVASRTVNNAALAASLADPGIGVSGTKTLTATATVPAAGLRSLAIEHRVPGGAWTELCSGATTPRSCDLDTTALPEGPRELRAVAEDNAGVVVATVPVTVIVDNTPPDPPEPTYPPEASGDITVTATAEDSGSGIAAIAWEVFYGGNWIEVCRDTSEPFECSVDSTGAADGVYSVRVIAIDNAGVQTVGDPFSIRVDNTAPSAATLNDPGAVLRGSEALSGTASDSGSGVASWTVQHRPAGGGAWTDACSDAAAAYGCSWATTGVADGLYDLRAVVRDAAGNETTSAVLSNRRVDNTAPAGSAIATGNVSGGTTGRLEAGDWLTLTWTEQIAPATVLAGWPGTSQAIVVRVTNSSSNDRMDFYNAANSVRLNLVNTATDLELGGNFATTNAELNATMAQSGNAITITLGTLRSGTLNRASAGTMRWRPSAVATDLAGNPGATTQVVEPGGSDRDF